MAGTARTLALLLALLASSTSTADDRFKRWGATRTTAAPRIDGRLDDAAWQLAPAETRFTQQFPDEGRPPSQRTELRVLYDDDALYIAVRAFDDHPKEIVERLTRRDRETDADKITVDVSSKNDGLTAYHFDLNVSGVIADGVRFNDTEYNAEWDGLWRGATSRDPHGWSAEFAIPFRTLRYQGGVPSFAFQVRRHLQRRQEIDEWAYVPRTARGEVSRYGTLTGLLGLRTRRLLQITPYVAGRVAIRSNQGTPQGDGAEATGNMGADLKLGVTSGLTLDATFNPDFGQVEADQVILNLTTFEIFFPERRPFFLEGAEIFATPFTLFYTRRIGRSPPGPYIPGDDAIGEPSRDGRIWAAAKLTGLVTRRLTIAVMDAITAREDATVTTGFVERRRLTAPLTNFGVLRLKHTFGESSWAGFTATAVTRFEPAGAAAPDPGDVCPDEVLPSSTDRRCTHDAYTGGLDVNARTSDGTWGGHVHVVGSIVTGGPTRLIPDGTRVGSGDAGWGINSEVGKYGGKHWLFKLEYINASEKLELNDAGYLQKANHHHIHPYLILRTKKPVGPLLEANLTAEFIFERGFDWLAELGQTAEVNGSLRFKNFWQLYAQFSWQFRRQDYRETRDGARTERTDGYWFELWGRTDPRRRVVAELWTGIGRVLHGVTVQAEAKLQLRPIPALELDLIPRGSWTSGDPRWFDTFENGDGSRRYQFGELESSQFDVTLRGTYTFTPRLTLQAYAQLFLAAGHYSSFTQASGRGDRPLLRLGDFRPTPPPSVLPDFREGAVNANVVLRWEWRPGSAVLVVYTHAHSQSPYDPTMEGIGRIKLNRFSAGAATDVLMLKLTALWG